MSSEENRIANMSERELKKTLNNIHDFLVYNYPLPLSVKSPLLLWWMKLGKELQEKQRQRKN